MQPIAGGLPISESAANQAAEWLTLFMSGEATDDDRRRWQHWREADADHQRAWEHIEAITGRLKSLPSGVSYRTLSTYGRGKRRKALVLTLTIAVVGGVAFNIQRADYHTGKGERSEVVLEDGSHLTLNTDSSVDVRFDAAERRVKLLSGELMVVSGHPPQDSRPLLVETAEGEIHALGTKFTVRQRDDLTEVAVFESAVEVTPNSSTRPVSVTHAGERVTFTARAVNDQQPLDESTAAWARDQLIADDMRLEDFMTELARYRPGVLRVDPAVADLRISGVFPLQDTDRVLESVSAVLPVRAHLRTSYWVTIEPAN